MAANFFPLHHNLYPYPLNCCCIKLDLNNPYLFDLLPNSLHNFFSTAKNILAEQITVWILFLLLHLLLELIQQTKSNHKLDKSLFESLFHRQFRWLHLLMFLMFFSPVSSNDTTEPPVLKPRDTKASGFQTRLHSSQKVLREITTVLNTGRDISRYSFCLLSIWYGKIVRLYRL